MISKNQIKYIHSLEQKKNRRNEMCFVAEGPKIIEELLKIYTPKMIFATKSWIEENNNIYAEEITEQELSKLSFLKHPQSVLAVFPIPQNKDTIIDPNKLYLALDGVQDPGNLGTIIRIADWFGIDTILCSMDTADAFNPKVVQATMGSIARVKIIYTNLYDLIKDHANQMPIYGTLLDGENIYQKQLAPNGIIIMGNEGNGISTPIRNLLNERLLIPSYNLSDTAESLNVATATAIICSEFRRRF